MTVNVIELCPYRERRVVRNVCEFRASYRITGPSAADVQAEIDRLCAEAEASGNGTASFIGPYKLALRKFEAVGEVVLLKQPGAKP